MLTFGLRSTSDDWLGWSMDSNPICHPSPAKKLKYSFLDYVQLLMLARLVDGLEPYPPPLSRQKNEMLIFGLCSTSDDWPGWLMDSNPIHHPSPAKKNEKLIFGLRSTSDVGRAGQWTLTPSTTPLQLKTRNAHFWITFTSHDRPGWLMDSNPICHPSPVKKMKCLFLDYVQLLMISRAGQWTQNPICHPSPAKKTRS